MIKRFGLGKLTAIFTITLLTFAFWQVETLYSKPDRYLGKKITKVDFEGNVNVPTHEIYNLIQMRPGMVLTLDLLNEDLKAIYGKGEFAVVKIEGEDYKEGVAVLIIVKENPVVNKIQIKGAKKVNESELRDGSPLKVYEFYTKKKLNAAINFFHAQYREAGFFNAAVRVKVIDSPKKESSVDVVFIIDEGEEIRIGKINLIGVRSVDPQKLYSVMDLEEKKFTRKGEFKRYMMDSDKQKMIQYYKSQGYLDVRVVSADYEVRWENPKEKRSRVIVITYEIEENEQYFYNGYDIQWEQFALNKETNEPLFEKQELEGYFEQSEMRFAKPFDENRYERDRGMVNYLYSEKGYVFARVIADQTIIELTSEAIEEKENSAIQKRHAADGVDYYNIEKLKEVYEESPELRGKKFIHVRFRIVEGEKGYIESIIVKGNNKTRDYVISREFLIKEGELFNAALVQRSKEKIYNLGYFSNVDLDIRAGSSEGLLKIIVGVEEQLTGNLSLGGGYGSVNGFSIFTEISERNLNGTGQILSGKVEFGLKRNSLELSWTEPWIFHRPWSLTLRGFYFNSQHLAGSIDVAGVTSGDSSYYYRESYGASVGVGHRFNINWGHYHRISPQFTTISDPSALVSDEIYMLAARGWQLQNSLENRIYFDNRDNYMNPTKGDSFSASVEFVGSFMGGKDHYNRYSFSNAFYWWPMDFTFFNLIRNGVLRRWRIVLEHRVSAVYTQKTSPVFGEQDEYANAYIEEYDRLYLGGYESLRGWDPYDNNFMESWRYGGSHRLLYSTELRVPIEPNLLWFALFFDAGALFNDIDQYYIDESTPSEYVEMLSNAELNRGNFLSGDYYKYSWGVGIRVQVPSMPIRLYAGRRIQWDNGKNWFTRHPNDGGFEVVFGMGDNRF